jgi:hypothetical protein
MYIELRIPSLIVCETMDQKIARNHMHVVEKKYARSGRVHKNHNLVCHAAISPKSSHCKQNQFCVPYLLLDVLYFICSFKKSVSLLRSHGTSSPILANKEVTIDTHLGVQSGEHMEVYLQSRRYLCKTPCIFLNCFVVE